MKRLKGSEALLKMPLTMMPHVANIHNSGSESRADQEKWIGVYFFSIICNITERLEVVMLRDEQQFCVQSLIAGEMLKNRPDPDLACLTHGITFLII